MTAANAAAMNIDSTPYTVGGIAMVGLLRIIGLNSQILFWGCYRVYQGLRCYTL